MSLLPGLVAFAAVVLGGIGLWEILRTEAKVEQRTKPSSPKAPADPLGLADRIGRAGLDGTLTPRPVLLAKGVSAAAGMLFGSLFAGILPGRLAPVLLVAIAACGFVLPDLMLERAARRRHRRMVVALPDVLDLLAVSVQTGRGLGGCLIDLAKSGRGPLIQEMSRAGDDLAWGSGQAAALEGLRQRVGGAEITSFVSTLERSRRLGSPLAEQLRRQSSTLRQDQRRAIEEEAARAAPKIQLVIALILVPSVLLLIVAALAANANSLIGVGY